MPERPILLGVPASLLSDLLGFVDARFPTLKRGSRFGAACNSHFYAPTG
ncbi:MAG: hypothetical protein R3C18_02475 [Planctomycetaceae bacterium]